MAQTASAAIGSMSSGTSTRRGAATGKKVHRVQEVLARRHEKSKFVLTANQPLIANQRVTKADAIKLFRKFADRSPVPLGTLRAQLIADSTWKRATTVLSPSASETVVRLAHALRFAVRTWQSESDAIDWLLSPHAEFGGATPFSMLRTESGGRAVEYVMAALEYGLSV